MAYRQPSPKERLTAQKARSFIGRIPQQEQFERSLLQPNHANAKVIFSISGQGGVGKTTLLKEFRRIAERHEQICAYVDEGMVTNRVDDVPEAMQRLVTDLEAQGFKFAKFQEKYKALQVRRQELEAEPEAPKDLLKNVVRGGAKMGMDLAKSSIPIVGGMIDSESIAAGMSEMVDYGVARWRNQDEVRLVKETWEVLTPLFLEGIRSIPSDKTLVLLLDTYEITGVFLDAWVRSLLDEKFGALERGVLVCIAGRNPIDRNAWTEWESLIARSPLEPFTEAEARDFLAGQQIQSEAVIQEIWRLSSGGLPLLVSMMAAAAPTNADAVVDPCEDAVNRFLHWETDGAKRQLAQDGACVRVLNEDVVAALAPGQFDWLSRCAFVLREGDCWRYHSVVREQMLRYLGQRSPQRWAEIHGKLANFYETQRQGLGLETGKEAEDNTWRKYSLEWIYHTLCAAPQKNLAAGLNGFLRALKQGRAFAQTWAETIRQAGKETHCATVEQWGKRLQDCMVAVQEERYADGIPALTKLLASTLIEPKQKAIAYDWRGYLLRLSKQGDLGLEDLLNAIDLDGEDAEYHVDLGITYKAQERYEEAIAVYQKAIELDPQYAFAYNNLGITYDDQKRYEEAIAAYQKAIELNPQYAAAYNNLGNTYKNQKRYEEAIAAYQKAIELNPQYAAAYYNLGNTYRDQKRYEEAIAAYQKAIELDPQDAAAYNNLGNTYRDQKRYEEAIAVYQKAIELDPQYVFAYNNLGNTYRDQKHYEEAIAAYQKAIELNPQHAAAYNNLGNTYRDQKRYEEAIVVYQKAIELNPQYATAYNNLGITYRDQKRYEEAIAAYQKAIELDAEDAAAYNNLGITYNNQKQYEEAIAAYQKAIELNPQDANAYYNLGNTYRDQKRYEEAIAAYQKAIELNPQYAAAYYNLGITYYDQKRYEEAIAAYQKAIELNPQYAAAYYNLGNTYRDQKRYEEAIAAYQKAIELNHEDREELAYLGLLQYQLEQYDEALQSFQKALNLQPENANYLTCLSYLYLLRKQTNDAQRLIEKAIANEPSDRAWLNLGLVQSLQGQQAEAKDSWEKGLNLLGSEGDWDQAVRYVFTVALVNPAAGLEKMQTLIASGTDRFTLRNALNDATILARSPQPIEGLEEMIHLLQTALS
jgi:tetratricopeptide (TPR) repeat protein